MNGVRETFFLPEGLWTDSTRYVGLNLASNKSLEMHNANENSIGESINVLKLNKVIKNLRPETISIKDQFNKTRNFRD